MNIQHEFSLILAIYFGLAMFGIGFNQLVAFTERRGWLEGYTWLAVAIGVSVVLGSLAIVHWQYTLITLGAFVAAGLPMALGSIWRHVTAREKDQRDVRQTPPVA